MLLKFKKVIMHNFLSFGDAEVSLNDRGYCLVSGINNYPLDRAKSNGVGKSSWSSAICWVLTGETIQGLKTNLKNINSETDGCWVKLFLAVDNDEYEITRYKEPKSDLKIIKNSIDISGKGIKESEIALAENIPDLTSQLLGSIVILGQGLPYKFSDNTPSGRKEVLEHLSKSDFMIQDLKNRIIKRSDELANKLRVAEDKILALTTQQTTHSDLLNKATMQLAKMENKRDFNAEIQKLDKYIEEAQIKVKQKENNVFEKNKEYEEANNQYNSTYSKLNAELLAIQNAYNLKVQNEGNSFNDFYKQYLSRKTEIEGNIKVLQTKITQVKNIRDVCPTCGQRILNVVKPSTANEEAQVVTLNESLTKCNNAYTQNNILYQKTLKDYKEEYLNQKTLVENKYKVELDEKRKYVEQVKQELAVLHQGGDFNLSALQQAKVQVLADKTNYETNYNSIKKSIEDTNLILNNIKDQLLYNNSDKDSINEHIKVVNKLNTLIKRDFRGFLLSNIINYIESKAKEYAVYIFGSDELSFKLEGNDIDISYANKPFENLSGGEKQKVDLAIQFAIRDMMSQYLGFSSNILILDEIFDNLDSIGCANVLNIISDKLNDIESMFIVSHHVDELSIPNDSEMVIIKDENGVSRIK